MDVILNKTSRLLACLSVISLAWVCPVFAGITTEVVLSRSAIMSLKKPVSRMTLANPEFADALLISQRQIQINGLKIGKTTLIIWEEGNEKPVFYDLIVRGDQATIEQQIKELAPQDTISVRFASDTVILSGNASRDQIRTKAEDIAKAFAPKVLNHILLPEPQQVLLQVKVAQVDRGKLKNLGIKAIVKGSTENPSSDTLRASGIAGTGLSATDLLGMAFPAVDGIQLGMTYLKGGIGASLQALVTKGYAKILAEPNLLVKSQPTITTGVKTGTSTGAGDKQTCSGEPGFACFLAGKQYPYITGLDQNGRPQYGYKDVGIKLVFHAEVLETGLINIRITPASVSAVIGFVGPVDLQQPIIDIREVNTEVELGDGQSLVLAGLLSEAATKTMSKIPLLGDIPILGALFRSTSDDISEKELVFFVTPSIVKPADNAGEKSKFVAKDGQKYELPGDKLPIGMEEKDLKVAPDQERDFRWVPLFN